MKKTIFLYLSICFLCLNIKAQTVINATGNSINNGTNFVDYSIGEIAVETAISSQNIVTQGFIQPLVVQVIPTKENKFEQKYKISAFPNPTNEGITIQTDYTLFSTLTLTDELGKKILIEPYNGQFVDFSQIPAGIYYITLSDNIFIKTIKITKL